MIYIMEISFVVQKYITNLIKIMKHLLLTIITLSLISPQSSLLMTEKLNALKSLIETKMEVFLSKSTWKQD